MGNDKWKHNVRLYALRLLEGAVDLTPSILYVYALKLYQTAVDEKVIDRYASLCVPEEFEQASADPFALEEIRKTYQAKLQELES